MQGNPRPSFQPAEADRKSTRLNSSHLVISYAVFCLKKKHMAELFMEPVFLASGFYFPVRALGFWVGMGTSIIPLTLALDAMRQLLFPESHPALLPVRAELGALVGLAVMFMLVARWSLRKMEDLARRGGRLSLRFRC